jgi:hypothetical protein
MEQMMTQTATFNPAVFNSTGIDDHWILDQLFGIRNLEKTIQRTLRNCGGAINEAIRRQIAELDAWVEQFDEALECNALNGSATPKPGTRVARVRAS